MDHIRDHSEDFSSKIGMTYRVQLIEVSSRIGLAIVLRCLLVSRLHKDIHDIL